MSDPSPSSRLALGLVTIACLTCAGTVALLVASSRIGEQKASTFGQAYRAFEQSWGGEQTFEPPELLLEWMETVSEYDHVRAAVISKQQLRTVPLYPSTIRLELDLGYAERSDGWLRFKTYESFARDTYTVVNDSRKSGPVKLRFFRPAAATLMYDFTFQVEGEEGHRAMGLDDWIELVPELAPGASVTFHLGYRTKGVDTYRYRLSALSRRITDRLEATLRVDTARFRLLTLGLPHQREEAEDVVTLRFDMKAFSTSQDLGVVFDTAAVPLEQVEKLVTFGPVALFLFLVAIFAQARVRGIGLNALHLMGLAMVHGFYFAFVSYLIRFFGLAGTFGIAFTLAGAMAVSFATSVLGRRFSLRVVIPYFVALTLGHSIIFLTPVIQGLGLLLLIFGVFASLMPKLARVSLTEETGGGES